MGYEIEFYKTENGRKPVEEVIKSLQEKQIAKILRPNGIEDKSRKQYF
jgi:hypothetical protein